MYERYPEKLLIPIMASESFLPEYSWKKRLYTDSDIVIDVNFFCNLFYFVGFVVII